MTIPLNTLPLPALALAYNCGSAAAARLFGVKVHEFALGFGPCLVRKMWRGTELRLNLLFFAGAYVRMSGPEAGEDGRDAPLARPEPPGIHLSELNPLLAALLFLAGPAASLLVATVALGVDPALGSFVRGFWQPWLFLAEPFCGPPRLGRAALHLFTAAPATRCAGVLGAKFAAWNLFPIPPLNGFHVLKLLAVGHREPRGLAWLMNAGFVFLLLILLLGIHALWTTWRAW
jgi:membrane-associated protease RseP (regulator of RpoE activity)